MPEIVSPYADIFEVIVKIRNSGGNAVLVTVISCKGSTPRKEGAKMIVFPDGQIIGTVGGGIREADIITAAIELFTSGESKIMKVDFTEGLETGKGPVCGGVMEVFMELIGSKRRAVISGAGHIGFYLYRILDMLEYHSIIIDPRPELNNKNRFPNAEIVVKDFKAGLGATELNGKDAVVLVGPGHDADREMLPSVLKSGAGYIGMIGSKRKIKEVYDRIKSEGEFNDNDFDRIYSPIGLDIGSESPSEIAVAIAAEIVKHFNS